ncbi:MAG: hypothetical protein K6F79_08840 [Saccharofermentans sp.]|nr:hypothetical protein [Saccharofermentans sp.]
MDKKIKYGLSFLVAVFLILYIWDFLNLFTLRPIHIVFWIFLAASVGFILAGKNLSGHRKLYTAACFVALLCIYSFRVLPDLYTPYLWCEDGLHLIQRSILGGPASLFEHSAGYCWLLPKLISLLCYWFCLLFNNITLLPQLQGAVAKIIAVASIMYFMSDRFEWLVKSRVWRFAICVLVVLFIPQSAYDTVPVDTSLPFVMNFTVFIIGLDCLLGPKARPVTVFETVFLSVLSLSTASAPFCAAVAVFALGRWFWDKGEKKEHVPAAVICTAIVSACALFQTVTTVLSPREVSDLSIVQRLIICAHDFIFFPYFESYGSALMWIAAFAGWIAIACLAKTSWKIVLYSGIYSYGFLFYCSMVGNPGVITEVISSGIGARYYLMNYMIAFFLLGVHIFRLMQSDKVGKSMGAAICLAVFFMAGPTYFISIPTPDLAFPYAYGSGLFDRVGTNMLVIPIAPTTYYKMVIPFEISDFTPASGDAFFEVDDISEQDPASMFDPASGVSGYKVSGWAADPDGNPFEYVLLVWLGNQYEAPTAVISRQDVSERFNNDRSDYGFTFDVDTDVLSTGDVSLVGITSDGQIYNWSTGADIAAQ